ncbi:hypothetical protein PLESTF_000219300 [Pleodorina starrii]|nr:hypothetical protein PLESTF_000219300 [Pleodorina starrii]
MPVSTSADPNGQLAGPQIPPQAKDASTVGPVLGDSPVHLEPILDSPAHSDAATVQAILPAAYLLEGLLEGSGETSGNLAAAALPRGNKKLLLGGPAPPATATAGPSAGPSAGPRSVGLRREKSVTGAAACTPRSGQTCATPATAGTARKAAGASTPSQRQTTSASSARPMSSTKPSQPRAAGKASAAAATTTPGRQSSQKPRRPSTAATDSAREAALRAAERMTLPLSASVVGAAAQPAAGNTGGTPVADGELLAGVVALGAGTPFFLKRDRPALGTTPPITPFSNMKCPPIGARGAGSTPPAPAVPAVAGAPTAQPSGKAQAPAQQRVKRAARSKAPAAATLAKVAEPEAKAGQTSKAAAASRTNAGGDTAAIRRNSSGGGPTKAASGAKPAAPQAVPAAAKALAAAAGRTGAGHVAKPAAAGPAGAHKKETVAKQGAGKHVAEAAAAAAKAVLADTDPGLEGHAAEPQVKLGRAGSAGGAGVSGAAAGRYGNSQSIASDSIGGALAAACQAACHSPDKLPPSKRYAVPVTSPSKRPRQERAPSAPPVVPLPLGAPAAGAAAAARGGAAAAGRSGRRGRSTARPASSPAMRAALAAKNARSLSANARRPRPSLPGTAAEHAPARSYSPMQITPGGSARKAQPAAAAPPPPPQPAAGPESPLAQPVPILNFDGPSSSKSPMGTPNLRPPSAAVAADIMPLRQQPVGTVRSPVLFGAAASARRLSTPPLGGVSPAVGPGAMSPAAGPVNVVNTAARRSPAVAQPPKQPARGSLALSSARGHAADGPRSARGHQSGDDPTLGGLVKAKARSDHGAGRAGTGPGGDGGRPLTARQGVGAAPATKAAPAVQRPTSARPGAIHKPVTATAAGGAAATKLLAAAATATAAVAGNGAGTAAATAGIVKAGAVTAAAVQASAGNIKPAKAAAAVATTAAAATAAPKAKQPALRGSGGPGDATQHPSRAPEPPGPAAAAEDRRTAARQAPRGSTGAAGARPEPLARGAGHDPEQERAQRRRQYEALLGRSGSASHGQDAATAAVALEEAAAAAPPAGKSAAKPQAAAAGPAASSQPERAPARKAPVLHHITQPVHGAQPRAAARQPAPQPQRTKPAATTAKHTAAGAAAPALAAAAGGSGLKASDAAGHQGPISSDAHTGTGSRQATPDTVQGLSPQDGLPGMPAMAFSTAAPEEVVTAEMGSLTLDDAGVQEPGADAGGAEGSEQGASPQETAEQQGATPKRPPDLSWLMDASPSASLAVTPGALAPINGFGIDARGFGFGELSADGSASGRVDTAPSTGFLGFGASAGDVQPQLVPATTCTLEDPGIDVMADDAAFGAGPGDATVVVNKQLPPLAAHPMGLPPTGLAPGGFGSGGTAAAVPSSTFSNKTLGVGLLTPGPGQAKLPGPATNRAKAAGPAPAALRQAKLRFSWDPTANPVVAVQPGTYACPTPGMAADSFMGFGATAAVGHEATPTSLPNPLLGGGFGAGGLDPHRNHTAAGGLGCRPDGIAVGALSLGDVDAAMDQELSAEVPVPVQCTSPNTPATDAFGGVALGGAAADQGAVPVFGGAAGGLGRAGRAVQDSFDALRISSMSSWPIMRERESERV